MDKEVLEAKRDEIATSCFEQYDFGSDVMVMGHLGWEKDGSDDWLKVVYVKFEDELMDDSEKVSFHVKFEKGSTDVEDVYGLLVKSGSDIGSMPVKKSNVSKLK